MKVLAYRAVVRVRDFERDSQHSKAILQEVRYGITKKLVDYLLQTDEIFEICHNPHRDEYAIEASVLVEQKRILVSFDPETLPDPNNRFKEEYLGRF